MFFLGSELFCFNSWYRSKGSERSFLLIFFDPQLVVRKTLGYIALSGSSFLTTDFAGCGLLQKQFQIKSILLIAFFLITHNFVKGLLRCRNAILQQRYNCIKFNFRDKS